MGTKYLHKQIDDFKKSMTSVGGDGVSAMLSGSEDEASTVQQTLAKLEQDNESLGAGADEPELGESWQSSAASQSATVLDHDSSEKAKLDQEEADAKKAAEKNEHLFDKMDKDFKAKAAVKKETKDVQKQAKEALKAAGQLSTAPDAEKQDLGDPSTTESDAHVSTFSTVPASTHDEYDIKKLDAMASKLKASEHKTESNMQEIEHSYVKETRASEKMKHGMKQFKAEASAASKLADQDAPGELGESADDLQDEVEKLSALQQHVTHNLDDDEVSQMVSKSNTAVEGLANSALDAISDMNAH